MRVKTLAAILGAALAAAASAAEAPLELLKESSFQPVYMHGIVTAARGWGMNDEARVYSIRQKQVFLSGEECFTLSYENGVFSIVFKSPLNPVYANAKGTIMLSSRNGDAG